MHLRPHKDICFSTTNADQGEATPFNRMANCVHFKGWMSLEFFDERRQVLVFDASPVQAFFLIAVVLLKTFVGQLGLPAGKKKPAEKADPNKCEGFSAAHFIRF